MDDSRTTPATDPTDPATVTVSGTGATPDVEVPMVEGATGAHLPASEHTPSQALPDGPMQGSGVPMAAMIGAIALLAVVAVVLAMLLA